MILKILLL